MTNEVKASHILVKTEDEAKNLYEEIKAGKDFAEAAAEVSLCNDTPTTRSFLPGSIQNVVEQITASLFFMTQNG